MRPHWWRSYFEKIERSYSSVTSMQQLREMWTRSVNGCTCDAGIDARSTLDGSTARNVAMETDDDVSAPVDDVTATGNVCYSYCTSWWWTLIAKWLSTLCRAVIYGGMTMCFKDRSPMTGSVIRINYKGFFAAHDSLLSVQCNASYSDALERLRVHLNVFTWTLACLLIRFL